MLLCVIFGLMDGAFVSFAAVLSLLFAAYETPDGLPAYGTGLISLYGGMTTIIGVIASFSAAVYLKRAKTFLWPMRTILIGMTLVFTMGIFAVPSLNKIWVGISLLLLGVFLVPIIPLSDAFANELTFPIDPPLTQGLLLMCGMGFGAIQGLLGTYLCSVNPGILLLFYAIEAVISCGLSFLIPAK